MAKCDICGKTLAHGNKISIARSHVSRRTTRTFKPNLRRVKAVVNGETGTVRRDNGNSLNTFSGIFLHVQPGQNTFKYTGAACKIDIQYTGRWFV